jgi:hypothetical protein
MERVEQSAGWFQSWGGPARPPALATGTVSKLRLLGDMSHPTRIAFVEFAAAEGAQAALNCSGALLGKCAE